jgi:hypothetical protein
VTLERGTRFEIDPRPTPEEQAAIESAVARVRAEQERAPGAWWEAGVRENASADEEE